MKSRPKITRVQLITGPGKDFSLFGIVSAEPDYRLSLSINRALRISLKSDVPVEVPDNDMVYSFSRFSFHSGGNDISWHLISNKSGKNFLLNKMKKLDYIFQVCSFDNNFDVTGISLTLRNIDTITAVFTLNPDDIKDRNLHYLIP